MIEKRWVRPGAPLLSAASAWLLDQAEATGVSSAYELSMWLCVVRGRRAGRLLLRELLDGATAAGRGLIPPRIVTQGGMVEHLLDAGVPVAEPVERTLAWIKVLRETPADVLAPLMPEPPDVDDWPGWHRLARMVAALHEELAGAGVSMQRAAEVADEMGSLEEGGRWRVLGELLGRYRDVLRDAGLVDGHQSRWPVAQQQRSAAGVAGIALVGVVELNAIQRAAIESAAARVTAFVHGDESMPAGFDDFGCVRPEYWRGRPIPLDDADVVLADRPADQAHAVMRSLARFDGMYPPEDVIIGVGGDELRLEIERAAMWAEVSLHDAEGTVLSRTPAARLLTAVADYLEQPRFAPFATVLRHPDLGAWLNRRMAESQRGVADWLSLLDRYFADHLQQRFAGEYLGNPARAAVLREVHAQVQSLLESMRGERALGDWLGPIARLLAGVYADDEARERASAEALIDALAGVATAPTALQPALAAPAAIRMLLRELGSGSVPADPRRDAIEMLGWLDLHPDPAPVLIIAGVNDGDIPATTRPDPFLPDSMRAALGLPSNDDRYARDAYLMEVHVRAGKKLTLITGRRSVAGEPITPSRLLLACDERELPARVHRLFSDPPPTGVPIGLPAPASESRFIVPALPETIDVPAEVRVTDFRLFLECPYRFALQRLLGVRPVTDRVMELDGGQFGSLVHEVLCAFGTDETMASETSEARIADFVLDHLRDRARRDYGETPMPAVQVQLAQLEQRLRGFAVFEAQSRQAGWRIAHCEYELGEDAMLEMPDGAPMPIRGTIDRIDRHGPTGAWRIIDYKSGDSGKSPVEVYHGGRKRLPPIDALEWCDLQLPLYHYFAGRSSIGVRGDVQLGFIVLPRQSGGVAFKPAPWGEAELQAAIECAQMVVQLIRNREFTRNANHFTPYDPFARICQSMVLESAEEELEDAGAES